MSAVKRLAARVRRHRQEQGLSQAHVAERAGITREFLNRLEQGHFDDVGLATVERLAKVLKVKLTELVR